LDQLSEPVPLRLAVTLRDAVLPRGPVTEAEREIAPADAGVLKKVSGALQRSADKVIETIRAFIMKTPVLNQTSIRS
jgi:hypothetical protein